MQSGGYNSVTLSDEMLELVSKFQRVDREMSAMCDKLESAGSQLEEEASQNLHADVLSYLDGHLHLQTQ